MPKVFKSIPEKYESITRPVVMGIVRKVMADTGIEQNTTVQYLGRSTEMAQPGSTIDDDNSSITTQNTNRITVTVDEDYFEDRYSSQVLHRPENAFIFLDKALETYIKPVYSSTRVTVTMTFRGKDAVTAERWRDEFKTHMTDMRDVPLYELSYHYPIPLEQIVILEEIFAMRERQGGYGETLDKYFMDRADPRIRLVTNQAGKNPLVTIAETQGEIVGVWDFARAPQKLEKIGELENWGCDVQFTFAYEQPVGCDMSYPMMIHNQLMDVKYRNTWVERPSAVLDKKKVLTSSGEYLSQFNYGSDYVPLKDHGILIPPFDEFIPEQVVTSTVRLFSALVAIGVDDKRSLLNLKDLLPEYEFKPSMLALFKSEAPFICKPFRSIFNISLYRSTSLQYWTKIVMDEDLNISATEDLDIREYYHVRLSIMYDITALQPQDRDRLKIHGCAFADIMQELLPALPRIKTIGDCYVPGKAIDQAGRDVDEHIRGISINGGWQFNTVETLYVEAIKKKEL